MWNNSYRISKSMFPAGVVVVMLFFSLQAFAGPKSLPDPAQPGPYAIGHSVYVFNDDSRETTDSLSGIPVVIPRPVPVYVFYPVDQESIDEFTPGAVYPLDPVHPFTASLLSTSEEWEEQGFDSAYEEALPSTDGPFPLVMVSHGWGTHAWTMFYLGQRLASHGFVVALVYHYGDAFYPWEEFDNVGVGLINRPLDISFALTELLSKNDTSGELLHNLIDPNKVAVGGYSFGGYVAAALAGGDDIACDTAIEAGLDVPLETCIPVPPDPRIQAIVSLDGAHHFLKFDEMARITVPSIGIGEEWESIPALGLPESWQARFHAATQGHPSYRVDIAETDHRSFSNMCEALPVYVPHRYPSFLVPFILPILQQSYCAAPLAAPEAKRLITMYTVAFLKTTLSGETGYQKILTPGYALNNESMIEFFVTEKRNPDAVDESWPDEFIYFKHQPGSEVSRALKDPIEFAPIPYVGLSDIGGITLDY